MPIIWAPLAHPQRPLLWRMSAPKKTDRLQGVDFDLGMIGNCRPKADHSNALLN